jgi:mRNA interferase YafQ
MSPRGGKSGPDGSHEALVESTAFRKDRKRVLRRGYDVAKLAAILRKLQRGEPLPPSSRPHPLKGGWKGYWECHVEPDWLLVYKVTDDEVRLARTGTHADLFEK